MEATRNRCLTATNHTLPTHLLRRRRLRRRGAVALAAMAVSLSGLAVASMRWRIGSVMVGHSVLDLDSGCLSCLLELPHITPDLPALGWRRCIVGLEPVQARWWFDMQEFGEGVCFYAPLWPLVLAVGHVSWVVAPRRLEAGRCQICGYCASGLPEGATCPECGT